VLCCISAGTAADDGLMLHPTALPMWKTCVTTKSAEPRTLGLPGGGGCQTALHGGGMTMTGRPIYTAVEVRRVQHLYY